MNVRWCGFEWEQMDEDECETRVYVIELVVISVMYASACM